METPRLDTRQLDTSEPEEPWRKKTSELWLEVTSDPLVVGSVYDFLNRDNAGAVVVFSGTVRTYSQEMTGVSAIRYEAYVELVAARFAEIATAIQQGFDEIRAVALIHRIGEVGVPDASVLVGCAAGHRDAAFEGARYGIDAIKVATPIWKQEIGHDGARWSSTATPLQDVQSPMRGAHD